MTANGRSITQSEIDRSATLRRVAIVLKSLPRQTSQMLLGTFDDSSVAFLERAMKTLSDVDPMEQKRAMEAFQVSIRSQPATASAPVGASRNEAGSFERSSAGAGMSERAGAHQPTPHQPTPHQATPHQPTPHRSITDPSIAASSPILKQPSVTSPSRTSPLAFLGDVALHDLAEILSVEHPQAIALVLASIDPQVAANVLPRLPDPLRAQAVNKIGKLGEIPGEVASDLAGHFHAKLRQRNDSQTQAAGQRSLAAIMAAMPATESNRIRETQPSADAIQTPSRDAARVREELTNRLRVVRDEEQRSPVKEKAQAAGSQDTANRLQDRANVEESSMDRYTVAADQIHSFERHAASTPSRADATSQPVKRAETASMGTTVPINSTDDIHQFLQSLSPTELCQALGRVDTRDAMLTLCGLPSEVAEAALGVLPQDQSNSVRVKMANLNLINLREIDDAKERVAAAAQSIQQDSSSHERSQDSQTHRLSVPMAA